MVDDTNPYDYSRNDTRGLPQGFDPRMFYEYRYLSNLKTATGLEGLILKYMPYGLIRSVVFAIDPLRDFKVAPHRITPSNRQRKKAVESVLTTQRKRTNQFRAYSHSQTPNYNGISVCWSPGRVEHLDATGTQVADLTTQPPLVQEINDTTRRTRLIGSEQGTMDSFQGFMSSPARRVDKVNRYDYIYHPAEGIPSPECSERGGDANRGSDSIDLWWSDIGPTAAVLFPSTLNNLRTSELAYLEDLISRNVLAMFKDWSPNRRDYTLFRNVVELRDIPRSINSLNDTLRNLRSLFVSLGSKPRLRDSVFDLRRTAGNIPSEYLSYHFGWKQTYKDLMDLLALPEKMSKKYAFLIKRAGKPTTFRTKRTFLSALSEGVSGFDYDTSPYEGDVVVSHKLERETELRLVINATFDFPPPDAISLNLKKFLDQIGAVPRPTDIYNLVPWTWLLDWFTGLGNYVEVIDNINRDTSLINWGMITGQTKGRLVTNFKSKSDRLVVTTEDFVGRSEVLSHAENNHTSFYQYECRIRKDAATALNVNTTSDPRLSVYQKSILGALLAQRLDHSTPRTFRPRG